VTAAIITLLSDFGLKDPYVAEMKAVILTINPEARIVDISHSIEKFDIRMGAFVLASAARYFPKGTVHVAVVDPGVGTKRRALLVETEDAFYIGPDNGLLMLAVKREGIRRAYMITNTKLMLPQVSSTFHGRDVFAPAAAHLAKGTPPAKFGQEIGDYLTPAFSKPALKNETWQGEIVQVDDFGNIITNITSRDLQKIGAKPGSLLSIRLRNKPWDIRFCRTYGDAVAKNSVALVGSHGFLEIAVNQGNASERFEAKAGDTVTVSLKS